MSAGIQSGGGIKVHDCSFSNFAGKRVVTVSGLGTSQIQDNTFQEFSTAIYGNEGSQIESNFIITGNRFYGGGEEAIQLYRADGVQITGNTFIACSVVFDLGRDNVVVNNVFHGRNLIMNAAVVLKGSDGHGAGPKRTRILSNVFAPEGHDLTASTIRFSYCVDIQTTAGATPRDTNVGGNDFFGAYSVAGINNAGVGTVETPANRY